MVEWANAIPNYVLVLLIVIPLTGAIVASKMEVEQELSFLAEAVSEWAANVKIARIKRDSLQAQLIAVAREYAGYEKDILGEAAGNPVATFAVLTSLPSRYPNLSADAHYGSLLSNFTTTENELQEKIERHNDFAQQHNTVLLSPKFTYSFSNRHKWPRKEYIAAVES